MLFLASKTSPHLPIHVPNNPFDQNAHRYQAQAEAQKWMADLLLQKIKSHCNTPPAYAFEIGAGTGLLSRPLAQWMQKGRLEMQDLSLPMLFQNQMQMQDKPEALQVHFEESDLSQRPWPNCADLICGSAVIQWVPEFAQVFLKQFDQLQESCLIALNTLSPDSFSELTQSYENAFQQNWEWPIHTYSIEQWRETFAFKERDHSLKIIELCEEERTFYFESFNEILRHFKKTGTQGKRNRLQLSPSGFKKWNALYPKRGEVYPLTWKAQFLLIQKK